MMEIKEGLFHVMYSDCGQPNQMRHESAHKTAEAAIKTATENQKSVEQYDSTAYYVVQILGVAKQVPIESEYHEVTCTPPKPRASRKKSTTRKKTSRKKTARS